MNLGDAYNMAVEVAGRWRELGEPCALDQFCDNVLLGVHVVVDGHGSGTFEPHFKLATVIDIIKGGS